MCGAVRLQYCAGTLLVRSWYAHGSLLVRSWYAHGSLESSIDESVWYGTRFGLLAVGKRARMHGMHGMHGQYVDVKTYFLVQLLLDNKFAASYTRKKNLSRAKTLSALRPLASYSHAHA